MFGVDKADLLEGLENLRERICGYMGSTCDCKYGIKRMKNPLIEKMQYQKSEQTGCPEIRQAIAMLKALSEKEFYDLELKAGLIRSGVVAKALQDHFNNGSDDENN